MADVWTPEPGEVIENCLDNSLKRAANLLRSTGMRGDAIDASRIEWLRERVKATPLGVQVVSPAADPQRNEGTK